MTRLAPPTTGDPIAPPEQDTTPDGWSTADALRVYGIPAWGAGYFGINELGHLAVQPQGDPARRIDLFELVEGLRERDIGTPVMIRCTDVLRHRLREIREAFDAAIADHNYQSTYSCVYPIKVNQQRHLCEDLRNAAAEFGFGFEAGSKPELLAVMALTEGQPDMPIVCNGFKDSEFIETVILAGKLGRHVIPVVERFSDLELLVKHAERYGVRPRIGVRTKPSAKGVGRWESSAGMRSKFGLTATELLRAIEFLKSHGMADCLNMIHFHIGSQVGDIRRIKAAVNELAHIYCELSKLGAGLDTIDVGGGLGTDYDGSLSNSPSSVNYTVDEYAADIVYRVKSACDANSIAHPRILSESGRAMVSHCSMLVFDVLGANVFPTDADAESVKALLVAEDERPQPVLDLIDAYEAIDTPRVNLVEIYHDAVQAIDEAMSLFNLGYLSLPIRSAAERLFWTIGKRVLDLARAKGELPDDLADLPRRLSDIYFANLSIFQTLPDHWAIDQLFPICPIHRLGEEPTRRGILADITCDSDGQIDRFIDRREASKPTLELHTLNPGEHYYLGVFLLGAYQEVLGDLHNLYGDTHVVHVSFDDSEGAGDWNIDEVIEGDTVKEVLSYVQYEPENLVKAMRREVERAVKARRLTVREAKNLLKFYSEGMEGYTYLE